MVQNPLIRLPMNRRSERVRTGGEVSGLGVGSGWTFARTDGGEVANDVAGGTAIEQVAGRVSHAG